MKLLPLISAGFVLLSSPALAGMGLTFVWGDIPLCLGGKHNDVPNPRFVLTGVPAGTARVEFNMIDLDYYDYDHGGGVVAIGADGTIEPGAFTYTSPCPPALPHHYKWTAIARDKDGAALDEATAQRPYPE